MQEILVLISLEPLLGCHMELGESQGTVLNAMCWTVWGPVSGLSLKGYHVKKPNFVLDQKEDISNNSWNISSWSGLTCELKRQIFQGRCPCGVGLERSFRGVVHVELRFTDQSFKLKTTTKQTKNQPKQQNSFACLDNAIVNVIRQSWS